MGIQSKTVNELRLEAEAIGRAGDLTTALAHLAKAEIQATSSQERSIIWRGRANILQDHDRFHESLAASRRAAELAETSFDKAVARVIEVYTLGMLGDVVGAWELSAAILPHFADFPLGQVAVQMNLAKVYLHVWRNREALAILQASRPIVAELDQRFWQMRLEHDLGLVAERLDQLDMAEAAYQHTIPLARACDDTLTVIKSHFCLARLYVQRGAYKRALSQIDMAREHIADLPDERDVAFVDLQEAKIRQILNQPAQAKSLLESALSHYRQVSAAKDAAETLIELSQMAANTPNEIAQALEQLEQACELLAPIDAPVLLATARLAQAERLLQSGRLIVAAAAAESARTIFAEANLPLRMAQAAIVWADCCWVREEKEAAELYRQMLPIVSDVLPMFAVRCWYGLGRIAAARYEYQAAENAYQTALDLLHHARRTLHTHQQQAGFLEQTRPIYDKLFALLHQRDATPLELLAAVERSKARALGDLLARRNDQLATQLQTFVTLPADNIETHESAMAEKLRQLWQKSPKLVAASLPDVTELVTEEGVIVVYYAAENQLYALTIDREAVRQHQLPVTVDELHHACLHTWRRLLRPTSKRGLQRRLGKLWTLLIAPLSDRLQGKQQLTILPHAHLYHLPFAALFDADSQTYLVEKMRVRTVPSLAILERCQQKLPAAESTLLVGYSGADENFLPAIATELDAIAAVVPTAKQLRGAAATVDAVLDALPHHSLVHLASHAVFDSADPLHAGLLLADGKLTAAHLLGLPPTQQQKRFILSGCHAAYSHLSGADLIGLTAGLFSGGASSVVSALWQVDDAATAWLMTTFHQTVGAGRSLSSALQLAQRTFIAHPQLSHPFYWAAFVLFGAD